MTENEGVSPEESAAPTDEASALPSSAPAASLPPAAPARPVTPPLPVTPPGPGSARPAQGYPGSFAAPSGQPYAASVRPPAQPYAGQPYPGGPYAGQPQGASANGPGQAYGAGQAFGSAATLPILPLTTATAPGATLVETRKKSSAGRVLGLLVAAALVGGAAGLGTAGIGSSLWSTSTSSPAAGPSVVTVNNTDSVNNVTAIAAKVTPSVVTISAESGSSGGTGSGVVLSADGYILTNTHVVTLDGATADATISVTTSAGKVYKASVVGTDPTYDIAVIKLKNATGLTPLAFGDSSKINVGDQTIAIGAPLGLSNTVTTGIVSALNRSIEIASSAAPKSGDNSGSQGDSGNNGQNSPFYFDNGQGQSGTPAKETIKIAVIQTDAAINPGNSGGALVDSSGKLVGINVAIASTGGSSSSTGQSGSIGVGFSIPSNIAKRIADDIIASGKATHGLLGASVQNAASVEGSTITGAYVAEISSGGAAAAAGLQKGDVVTAFNNVPITDSIDLTAQVRAVAAGGKATVSYVRDGKTQTTDVTLGSLATN